MEVEESCSDGSATTLTLPSRGQQFEHAGYERQYEGKACRYAAMTMDSRGHPRSFGAHGYGDGDGGDSTPFLQ